jgi:hypothetical protein
MRGAALAFFLLAIPAVAAAELPRRPSDTAAAWASLQTARLDVALTSSEAAAFAGSAAWLFVLAGQERRDDCSSGGLCLDFSSAYAGVAAAMTIGMVGSTAMLVRSSLELRWRKAGTADRRRSARFNRGMISYDAIMTPAYLGLGAAITTNLAMDGAAGAGYASLTATASGLMAALHIWSIVRNARELKRRSASERGTSDRRASHIELTGGGLRW